MATTTDNHQADDKPRSTASLCRLWTRRHLDLPDLPAEMRPFPSQYLLELLPAIPGHAALPFLPLRPFASGRPRRLRRLSGSTASHDTRAQIRGTIPAGRAVRRGIG